MTQSHKHRTTTKSGGSGKSTKKVTSTRPKNSSRTPPASSGPSLELRSYTIEELRNQVSQDAARERERYFHLARRAKQRLSSLEALEVPKNALLRSRHKQKIAKERRLIEALGELVNQLDADNGNN